MVLQGLMCTRRLEQAFHTETEVEERFPGAAGAEDGEPCFISTTFPFGRMESVPKWTVVAVAQRCDCA